MRYKNMIVQKINMTNKHKPESKECSGNKMRDHLDDVNTRHDVKNRGCEFSYGAASFGMIDLCTCPPSEDVNKTYKTDESLVDSDPKSISEDTKHTDEICQACRPQQSASPDSQSFNEVADMFRKQAIEGAMVLGRLLSIPQQKEAEQSPDSQYREDKEAREEALRLEWKQYIDFAVGDDDSIEGMTYRGVADWWIRKLATIEASAYDRGFKEASVHCKLDHDTAYARGKEDGARVMKDAAEMLWVVLANVSGGDWSKQTQEWQTAAARWRDNYFASLTPLLNDKE